MKLKPCPFCGGQDIITEKSGDRLYYCYCTECGAMSSGHLEKEETITDWNTRPAEQELLEVLKELVKPEFHIEEFAEAREKAEQLIEKYEVEK